jgi:hypothetical protein
LSFLLGCQATFLVTAALTGGRLHFKPARSGLLVAVALAVAVAAFHQIERTAAVVAVDGAHLSLLARRSCAVSHSTTDDFL